MSKKNYLILITVLLMFFNAFLTVRADGSTCRGFENKNPSIGIMKRVSYVNTPGNANDLRADCTNGNCTVNLQGWLYYPKTAKVKNAPVLIFNHGHGDARNEPCNVAKYFVELGFVVFSPLRRGHYAKKPSDTPNGWQKIKSTGVFSDDYIANCLKSGKCSCNACGKNGPLQTCSENRLEIDYLRQQVADVRDQIRFIKEHQAINADGKLADPKRVALLGHSHGGSLIVFANRELNQQNVAIDISGAELSWGGRNPFWEPELKCSMNDQKRPIYFLQPKNGRTLLPTLILSGLAVGKNYQAQAKIFPPTPWNPQEIDKETGQPKPEFKQAHENFIGDRDQIVFWGPTVVEFINRYPLS